MVDALDDRSGTLFLPTTFVVALAFAFAVVIFVFAIVVVIMPAIMAMIAMYLAQLRSAAVTAVVLGGRAFRRRKQQRPSAGIVLIVRIPGLRLLCLFERCRNVVRHIDRHTGDTFSKAITLAVSSMCLLFLN